MYASPLYPSTSTETLENERLPLLHLANSRQDKVKITETEWRLFIDRAVAIIAEPASEVFLMIGVFILPE